MALTVVSSTSITLTASEQSLAGGPLTTAGTYVLELDLSNMAEGDIVTLNIYTKTRTGSTARLAHSVEWTNTQGRPNFQSPALISNFSIEYKLVQPLGTGRVVDYTITTL